MITSPQNEKVKLARALQGGAKARRKAGKIVLEGTRLVRDAVEQGQRPAFILYDPDAPAAVDVVDALRGLEVPLLPTTPDVMRHASDTQQPQGIIGVFPLPAPVLPPDPRRVLVLDAVRDPGNLGTILRAAGAAGVQAVLLAPTSVDPYNPKALRSGMGAHFRVPVIEADWAQIAAFCQPLTVYLADSQGDLRYDEADWVSAWALIIGGEAHGAGAEAERLAAHRVSIPMAAATESLNAALAASVILFEAVRQGRHR